MDVLKQKGRECAMQKDALLKQRIKINDGGGWRGYKMVGQRHLSEEEYGSRADGYTPLTNKYVKKRKLEMKREYRAVKHGENQKVRKEIERSILED